MLLLTRTASLAHLAEPSRLEVVTEKIEAALHAADEGLVGVLREAESYATVKRGRAHHESVYSI
jgi:hypothetical protein